MQSKRWATIEAVFIVVLLVLAVGFIAYVVGPVVAMEQAHAQEYCEGMARPSDTAPCPPANPPRADSLRAERVQRSESLEVQTAVATPDGPQLTSSGCYIYGQLIGTLNQGRAQGIPKAHYHGLVLQKPANIPGADEFIHRLIDYVYAWPPGMDGVPYQKLVSRYADECRKLEGRTWLFYVGA